MAVLLGAFSTYGLSANSTSTTVTKPLDMAFSGMVTVTPVLSAVIPLTHGKMLPKDP